MRNPVISLAVLAAFFLAAPLATAGERYPLYKDLPPLPEFLPDDAFGWSTSVGLSPIRASVLGGLMPPYRDTYGEYAVHLGCSQELTYYTYVSFEFPRRRSLRAILRARRAAAGTPATPFRTRRGAAT